MSHTPPAIGRRTALASAAVFAWGCTRTRSLVASAPGAVCLLTPEQVEGPYYLDDARVRRDLREGQPGVPLSLAIEVVDARTCRPLVDAAVDIWHCNAAGLYSGFTAESSRPMQPFGPGGPGGPGGPEGPGHGPPPGGPHPPGDHPPRPPRGDALMFLRGTQLTDASGRVELETIYPGWYPGRAIHVHARVRTGGAIAGETYRGGHVAHTGQLYVPEQESDQVLTLPAYAGHVGRRMLQSEDFIFTHGGASGLVDLRRIDPATSATGYRALVTMVVDPVATPTATM